MKRRWEPGRLDMAVDVLFGRLKNELPDLKGDCPMVNSLRPGDRRSLLVRSAVTMKLAAGKAVFGPIISDFSMSSARTWARSDADYVWIDMEHNPMNMEAIANFIAFSNDRSY